MRNWSPLLRKSGYSLLEITASLLIFSLILMVAATSLLKLISEKKSFGERQNACRLAQNLTETMLALPLDQAKSLNPEEHPLWSDSKRYAIRTRWEPDIQNANFEKLSITYLYKKHPLLQVSVLHIK